MLRLFSWGVIDQGISSVGNLALMVTLAHSLSIRNFAAASLLFSAYIFFLTLARGVLMAPLFLGAKDLTHARQAGLVVVVELAVGIGAAGIIAGAGILFGIVTPALMLALFLPALLVQDGLRQLFLSQSRPRVAVSIDILWTGSFAALWFVVVHFAPFGEWSVWLLWLACGSLSAILGMTRTRPEVAPRALLLYVKSDRSRITNITAEYLILFASGQGLLYLLPIVGGANALVGFRAASQNLLGLVNTLIMGLNPQVNVELKRRSRHPVRLQRFSLLSSAALALSMLLAGPVLYFMPDIIGRFLAGVGWPLAQPLLPAAGAYLAAAIYVSTRMSSLRWHVKPSQIRNVKLLLALISLVVPSLSLYLGDRAGFELGLATSAALQFILGEWFVRSHPGQAFTNDSDHPQSREDVWTS